MPRCSAPLRAPTSDQLAVARRRRARSATRRSAIRADPWKPGRYGSTGSPPPGRTSRWRCGPVMLPVEPTVPICWPALTVSPAETPIVGLVAVPDLGAVLEGLDGLVAVGAVVAGLGDLAVGDRDDRGAGGGGEVEAGVVAATRGRRPCRSGRSGGSRWSAAPLVLGDLAGARLGGLAERLELGVALGGLLLGRLLELHLGGVLEGLALGVAADRPLAGVAGEADGVGAGRARWAVRRPWMALGAGGSRVRPSRRRRRRRPARPRRRGWGRRGAVGRRERDAAAAACGRVARARRRPCTGVRPSAAGRVPAAALCPVVTHVIVPVSC